jgi:GTP-binding protein
MTPAGATSDEARDAPGDDAGLDRALRAGLDDYDLSDEDRALLASEGEGGDEGADDGPLPVLAIVGRPNVGK